MSDAAMREHALRLRNSARDVIGAFKRAPDWAYEAEGDWMYEVHAAVSGLQEELEAHKMAVWMSQRAATVGGLIAWQEAHPAGTWLRVDVAGDGRAVVTDGHALLTVSEPVDVPVHKRAGLPGLDKLLAAPAGSSPLMLASEQVEEWIARAADVEGKPALRIGDWVMDAQLADRWLSPVLAIAPGPVTVDASGDPREPSRWTGPGWTVVVMPMVARDATAAPDLAERA
jgi:hypothetical protein